ncbi:MAG: hypothetical protein U0946_05860 [Patescibacteria group bacterium]|nr:hypothetical protein [Patescibacteria group bacterium]
MDEHKKKYTVFSKVVITGIVLTTVLMSVINGTYSNPVRVFGAFFTLFVISSLVGLIPYFIFRNKVKNPKIIIFGIVYIILELLFIVATIKVSPSEISTTKPVWVDKCTNGGDGKKSKYCNCLFDSLAEKYTLDKFSKMGSSTELSQSINDLGKKCLQNDGYLFDNELKETYKKSYVENCIKKDASEITCTCYFNFLIERLGLEGFNEMGKALDEKPVNSPEVKKYLDIVTEQKNKCGVLE